MRRKDEPIEPEQQEELYLNTLSIGSLTMHSPFDSMDALIKKAKELLRDPVIKDYLFFCQRVKNLNGYLG